MNTEANKVEANKVEANKVEANKVEANKIEVKNKIVKKSKAEYDDVQFEHLIHGSLRFRRFSLQSWYRYDSEKMCFIPCTRTQVVELEALYQDYIR